MRTVIGAILLAAGFLGIWFVLYKAFSWMGIFKDRQ